MVLVLIIIKRSYYKKTRRKTNHLIRSWGRKISGAMGEVEGLQRFCWSMSQESERIAEENIINIEEKYY
jgi:hypothetical protein